MSTLEINKTTNLHDESAHSLQTTQKASVKKETVTSGSLSITKGRDIDVKKKCIDHHTDTNEEVDAEILANVSEFKVHVISPMVAEQKPTIKELYESMVDFRMLNDRTQSLASLQTQVAPPIPTYYQAQGYPGQGQGYFPSHQVQPPGQGYGYQQPPGYDQNPGYVQRVFGTNQGYPQNQGYYPPQGYTPDGVLVVYNPRDRNPFVALVMGVTCIMLMTTSIFIGVLVLTPALKSLFQRIALVVLIPSMVILIGVNYAFACCQSARKPMCGTTLLILTVIAMSLFAGAISCQYNTEIILQAVIATAIIVAVCTGLAFTKFDFTSYILYMVMIGLVLMVITMIFFAVKVFTGRQMTVVHLVILIIATLLQAVILVAELQMILGGKAIELHEDEWALGAYYLYTSIVNLFIKMLAILGIFGQE